MIAVGECRYERSVMFVYFFGLSVFFLHTHTRTHASYFYFTKFAQGNTKKVRNSSVEWMMDWIDSLNCVCIFFSLLCLMMVWLKESIASTHTDLV